MIGTWRWCADATNFGQCVGTTTCEVTEMSVSALPALALCRAACLSVLALLTALNRWNHTFVVQAASRCLLRLATQQLTNRACLDDNNMWQCCDPCLLRWEVCIVCQGMGLCK